MPVTIEIQNLQTIIPLRHAYLIKTIQKVLKAQKILSGRLSFVFVNDARMRALNKKYLRHDYPTDVLSFDLRSKHVGLPIDGEIIISSQTAKRNAAIYGVSTQKEILLYMIHGLLHLCGYDDHSLGEIQKMRKKEKQMLDLV